MRPVLIALMAIGVSLGPAARTARAVTTDDLVNLSAHGLSDEVLVALIDADGSHFNLTPADVLSLKSRGLSDAVLLSMIRTAVPPEPPTAPVVQAPIVYEPPAMVVRETPQGPPEVTTVFVPVAVAVPVPVVVAVRSRVAEAPVYWGFGGKLRGDAWKPSSQDAPSKDQPKDPPKTPVPPASSGQGH